MYRPMPTRGKLTIDELHYCSLICYWLVCILWASASNSGCHFGHHCCRRTSPVRDHAEVNRNKLITALILWIYINPSIAALEKICARASAPQAVSIHQIHTARGVGGSTTMVVVFVVCVCCVLWSRLVIVTCCLCRQVPRDNPEIGLWV